MTPTASRLNRGQALAEFAIVIPVLLLIFMVLLDFGRAVYAYNTVAEAARNGARVAIVNQTLADVQNVAAGRAVALGIDPSGVTMTPSSVATGISCPPLKVNKCAESVTVTYDFTPVTPVIGQVIGSMTLTSTSKVVIERLCSAPGDWLPGESSCPLP